MGNCWHCCGKTADAVERDALHYTMEYIEQHGLHGHAEPECRNGTPVLKVSDAVLASYDLRGFSGTVVRMPVSYFRNRNAKKITVY